MNTLKIKSKSLPWDVVEKAVNKEIKWLKETIEDSPFNNREEKFCNECIFRKIAILILSGKIKAKDIKSSVPLWGKNSSFVLGKFHGKDWHSGMMRLLASYFKSLEYEVAIEPNLNFGRADLGVYKEGERALFIEVGTVSISKLLFNLKSMEDTVILLVLSLNHAVEFSVLKTTEK